MLGVFINNPPLGGLLLINTAKAVLINKTTQEVVLLKISFITPLRGVIKAFQFYNTSFVLLIKSFGFY